MLRAGRNTSEREVVGLTLNVELGLASLRASLIVDHNFICAGIFFKDLRNDKCGAMILVGYLEVGRVLYFCAITIPLHSRLRFAWKKDLVSQCYPCGWKIMIHITNWSQYLIKILHERKSMWTNNFIQRHLVEIFHTMLRRHLMDQYHTDWQNEKVPCDGCK